MPDLDFAYFSDRPRGAAVKVQSWVRGGCVATGLAVMVGLLSPLPSTGATGPRTAASGEALEAFDARTAIVSAAGQDKQVEDLSRRTPTSQEFANPDGTWTHEETTEPVRALNDQGEWADLDTTLVQADGKVAPRNVNYELELSAGGDQVFAAMTEGGKDLAWRWPTTLPKPELTGSSATYRDAVLGGDLVVTAIATGFSYNIVLRERPGSATTESEGSATDEPSPNSNPGPSSAPSPNGLEATTATTEETETPTTGTADPDDDGPSEPVQYSIPVTTDGAKLSEDAQGGMSITTKTGDVVTSTPGLMMWDSRTNAAQNPSQVAPVDITVTRAGEITPQGENAGATPVLTIQPDQAFLADPETVYPVTIDPTQVVNTNGDTWVQTNDTGNRSGDSELHVGYDGTTNARTYLMFSQSLNGLVGAGYKILDATLTMRNYKSLACTGGQVNAARITSNWSPSAGNPVNPNGTSAPVLNWANQPNHTNTGMGTNSTAYGYTGCAGNWANFDVTDIITGWADSSFANYGIKVRANTEGWTPSYREYRSTNSTANQPPKLTINYDAKPTVTGLTLDPCVAPCTTSLIAGSTTPDLLATVADTETAQVTANFELRQAGNTAVIASGSDTVPSGTAAVFSVPPAPDGSDANLLEPGGNYEFRAAANDGNYQIWSAWKPFSVAANPDAATALTLAEPLTIYDTGATLSWTGYLDPSNAQSDDLVEYQIFRGCTALPSSGCSSPAGSGFPAGGNGLELIATVDKDKRTYTDTTATASTASDPATYRYWVGARTQADVAAHRDAQVATNSQQTTTPRQGRVRRVLSASDPTTAHDGYDDTTLSQTQPTTVLAQPKDGAGVPGAYIQAGSAHPSHGNERATLDFDLSSITPGLIVTDAHLDLKQLGGGGTGSAAFELRALTNDFDETSATWNNANTTTPWTSGGGDLGSTLATLSTDSAAKLHQLSGSANEVRTAVQGWVNTPANNHGFLLKAANETGGAGQHWLNIASGESLSVADRPRLVVENLRTAPAGTFSAPTMQERFLPNTVTTIPVTITNTTNTTWPSTLQLAYRWAAVGGTADTSSFSSDRYIALGRALAPGESILLNMRLRSPINSSTGQKVFDYDLFLDLWTGSTWFSSANPYSTTTLSSDQRTQRLCTVVTSSGGNPGGLLCPNRVVDQAGSTNLGLEQFYTFTGEATGGGGQLLTNLLTGNVLWNYDAYANPSIGPSMFTRVTYNSRDNGTTGTIGSSGTGFGWSVQAATLNRLGTALSATGNNKEVTLVDGDGTQHTWTKNDAASSGTITAYDRPPGVRLKLTLDSATTTPTEKRWKFTRPDGTRFYFDDNGYPRSVVDKNANTLTYNYTGTPGPTNLTSISDSTARTVATLTWVSSRLQSITDISGRGLRFTYNSANQITQITDGGGFNPATNTFADPNSAKTFGFTYTTATTSALLATTTDPLAHTTAVDYYTSTDTYPADEGDIAPTVTGWPKTITSRLYRSTGLRYYDDDGSDGNNIRTKVTATDDDAGTSDDVTTYTTDGFGRTISIKDANQNATSGNATTDVVWDIDHNVTRVTQPDGATSRWLYDTTTGYPLKIWDAEAVKNNTNPRTLTYAPIGTEVPDGYQLTSTTTPAGKTTTFAYDTKGNLLSVTDPLNRVTGYTYNTDGTTATATNARSKTTTFTYDPAKGSRNGSATTITPPTGIAATDYTYDLRGNVLTTAQTGGTTPTTLSTTAVYDGFGRTTSLTTPGSNSGSRTTVTAYDRNDNIVSVKAPNGYYTTTTYADDDLPTTQNTPRNSTSATARQQSWTYDHMRRLIATTSPEGNRTATTDDRTIKYTYDHLGQITETRQPWAGGSASAAALTQNEYDKVGNLIKSTDPLGNITRTVYDANRRPVSAIDAAGFATRTRYDLDSQVTAQIDQRGNLTSYTYDDAGQLIAKSVKHTPTGAATQTWISEYEYDNNGNPTKTFRPRLAGSAKTLFDQVAYDDNDQATEKRAAFDPADTNTTYRTAAITYSEYDTLGRLNRQSAPTRAGSGSQWTSYAYYDSGEIQSSTDPWNITTSYKYSTLGLQTERVLKPGNSGTATRTMSWAYWPDGSLASRDDNASPSTSVVTDNVDATPAFTLTGTWAIETQSASKYGTDYRTHAPATGSTDRAKWSMTPGTAGTYRIDVACPTPTNGGTAASAASYDIKTDPGTGVVATATKTLDQTTCNDDRTWRSLGTFTIAGGQPATVELKPSSDGIVVADAARLILLDNERAFNYSYDLDGNQTRVDDNDPNARVTTYTTDYDNAGRATQNQELNGSNARRTTTYTYDLASNPLTVQASRTAETNPNDGGNIASATFSAYCYDSRNQVSLLTTGTTAATGDTELRRFNYSYDPTGAVSSLTKPRSTNTLTPTSARTCNSGDDPTGNMTKYRYYETGLLRSLVETNPQNSNKITSSHYLSFTPDGDRSKDVAVTQNADTASTQIAQTSTYAYTPTRQLKSITKTGTNKSKDEYYVYDAAGNVLDQRVDGFVTNNTYDRNRLMSSKTCASTASGPPSACAMGGSTTSTTQNYDNFGRSTGSSASNAAGTINLTYSYDGFDRMTGETKSVASGPGTGWVKTTGYDAFDRPTLQTATVGAGAAKKTRYNYLGFTSQVAVEERLNSSNAWTAVKTYNYGLDARPLVLINTPISGATTRRIFGYNPHGDTEQLTDLSSGNTTATYRYTGYGNTETEGSTGEDKTTVTPSTTPGTDVVNPYRYSARRFDPASGQYDMGFRNYDPGLNRFLSRDMYAGALNDLALGTDPWNTNRYSLAGGNPINGIELDGHYAVMNGEQVTPQGQADPKAQTQAMGQYVAHQAAGIFRGSPDSESSDPAPRDEGFLGSVVGVAGDTVGGVVQSVVHADETAKGLWWVATNPKDGSKALLHGALEPWYQMVLQKDSGDYAGLAGSATSYAAMLVGGGGLLKALKDARMAGVAAKSVRYGPMNPGPLDDAIANTFRSGSYTGVTASKPTSLYRVYSGNKELGPYWTRTKPSGPVQSIIDSALDPAWGNQATNWVKVRVPAGTTFYEGAASSQGGLVGGGNQVFISRVDPSWVVGRGGF